MERRAAVWAHWLSSRYNLSPEEEEILAFALVYLIILLTNIGLLVLLGMACNLLWPTLYAALWSGLLRTFTGGAHFSTAGVCAFFSSLFMLACAWLAAMLASLSHFWGWPVLVITLAHLLLTTLHYAPVESSTRPLAGILAVNWQAFTLKPFSRRIYRHLEFQIRKKEGPMLSIILVLLLFSILVVTMLAKLYSIPWLTALPAGFVSFFLLLAGDVLLVPAYINYTGLRPEIALANPLTGIVASYVSNIFLILGVICAGLGLRFLDLAAIYRTLND